jgi:hypothetical protein
MRDAVLVGDEATWGLAHVVCLGYISSREIGRSIGAWIGGDGVRRNGIVNGCCSSACLLMQYVIR